MKTCPRLDQEQLEAIIMRLLSLYSERMCLGMPSEMDSWDMKIKLDLQKTEGLEYLIKGLYKGEQV